MNDCCENTDQEIWRKVRGDYYSPSIHVTEYRGIGINCGGTVIVAPVERWHEAGKLLFSVDPDISSWKRRLAMWLLKSK